VSFSHSHLYILLLWYACSCETIVACQCHSLTSHMTHSLFILAHYSVKLSYFYIIFNCNSQTGLVKKDNTCWQAATSLDYICWCSQPHDTCTKEGITLSVIAPVTCCCLPRGPSAKPVVHIPIAIGQRNRVPFEYWMQLSNCMVRGAPFVNAHRKLLCYFNVWMPSNSSIT